MIMFHYLYTNDMRIDSLPEKAYQFATMFLTDSLPSADEDKSLNNNGNAIGYYLNLKSKGNSAKLIANGNFRIVILNFIKKFQFPNPRTKESFINSINDEITLSPLREIIKLLFLAKLTGLNNFYLTKDEVENFIFFNKNVAKSNNFDRYSLLSEILNYRKTSHLPNYIASEEQKDWKQKDRQLNELIAILKWSGFIEYEQDRISLKLDSDLSNMHKAELYDIINFNEFWDYSNIQHEEKWEIIQKSYFEYIDKDLDIYLQNPTTNLVNNYLPRETENVPLSKPFLLLAGVSGTGKSRFIREQVEKKERKERYQLVAVRPDWHEPSDLLGYVSRLSGSAQYVMTDVLKFIVKAWQAIENKCKFERNEDGKIVVKGDLNLDLRSDIAPYWLCLDEMNLAPVEQYFADYLSVLETRELQWNSEGFEYYTEALLSPTTWSDISNFQQTLGVSDELWEYFQQNGIGIPFNLIVAGTVNMDETTHAFSRKVLDRALSFDFSEFYPNEFDTFFTPTTKPKLFTYPIYSQLKQGDLDDELVNKSIKFITALNQKFENTPFKLGYRALNELLLSIQAFQTKNDIELQAVWDDFVMTKVLPRIEGDETKVGDVLDEIETVLKEQLSSISQSGRPDLWRESTNEPQSLLEIKCRSLAKAEHMKKLLKDRGMVSFW